MPLIDVGSGRKGKNSPKKGKSGIFQTPPRPPKRKSLLTNKSSSSSSPSGVDASFSSTHSSSSSSAQWVPVPSSESNGFMGGKRPTNRILEYNLKPAANDNVGAGGADAAGKTGSRRTCISATTNSADNGNYDCTGETIEVMARGSSGLTLISSPPAPTPPSSPSRGSKLYNKLVKKNGGGSGGAAAKDDALTLSGDTSATSTPSDSVGCNNKNNSSTPTSKESPQPSYWERASSPHKMSPRALNLKKKVMSISGKAKNDALPLSGDTSATSAPSDSVGSENKNNNSTPSKEPSNKMSPRALNLKKRVMSISGKKKKDKSGGGIISSEDDEDRACFLSGETIEKGSAYYYATNVLSGAEPGGKDEDNHSRRLYTLSSSMKLLGCPTICDDDLRRMDKQYFTKTNRRLPEDLQLSSNWTRVAKHCTFSGKPIPDGVPFYYARRNAVDENGRSILGRFCYLRADVLRDSIKIEGDEDGANKKSKPTECDPRPLGPQDLMSLLANYPEVCDSLPSNILEDPGEWSLIDKFCFFSGGPIKADDTYYRANLDGKDIYLLVVLTPAVTARELFHLETRRPQGQGRQLLDQLRNELIPLNVQEVKAMDRVYDLSFGDFDSLRERHYGSYLKLPRRLVDPSTWKRVVPPSFLESKKEAMERAVAYETKKLAESPSDKKGSDRIESGAYPTEDQSFLAEWNYLVTKAKKGVQTLTCGAPQSFTLKELMQDDDAFLRELANEERLNRGNHDDESIGSASLDNLKATLQRYSSRVGGQSVISSDTRFTAGDFEMFDEFTVADDATFYTYATETTAGRGAWTNKNYTPDLG